jgi:hypothetical protein
VAQVNHFHAGALQDPPEYIDGGVVAVEKRCSRYDPHIVLWSVNLDGVVHASSRDWSRLSWTAERSLSRIRRKAGECPTEGDGSCCEGGRRIDESFYFSLPIKALAMVFF